MPDLTLGDIFEAKGLPSRGRYDMAVLTAVLDERRRTWMPLDRLTESQFARLEEHLDRLSVYPVWFCARRDRDGMTWVCAKVTRRRGISGWRKVPAQPWEQNPETYFGSREEGD